MDQSIIKIQGTKKGKTTVIMAGVHGNERSGIDAFKKILPRISLSSGVVYFVLANLKAIENNVRFVEKNMNRCFRKRVLGNSYEEIRVREIKKILNKADYLLDVHNTTNTISEAFLIGEEKKLAKYFPVKKFLSGIDGVQKGGSDGYMYNRGKIGLCIESGSIYDKKGPRRAEVSILNFLKITGNIDGKPKVLGKKQVQLSCYKMYKSKTNNFVLAKKFKDFEDIKKGEIIGYDSGKKVIAEKKGAILFAHDADQKGKECFVLTVYK